MLHTPQLAAARPCGSRRQVQPILHASLVPLSTSLRSTSVLSTSPLNTSPKHPPPKHLLGSSPRPGGGRCSPYTRSSCCRPTRRPTASTGARTSVRRSMGMTPGRGGGGDGEVGLDLDKAVGARWPVVAPLLALLSYQNALPECLLTRCRHQHALAATPQPRPARRAPIAHLPPPSLPCSAHTGAAPGPGSRTGTGCQ